MRNKIKILIGISILLLCISVAYAETKPVDIFTAPSPLLPLGNSAFADGAGHNIMICEYDDSNIQTWFQNDTDPEYLVEPYEANNSFYLGVDDENDCYILEVVEKEGTKYIVASWTPKGALETATIWENLQEFNKINKLTPIEV